MNAKGILIIIIISSFFVAFSGCNILKKQIRDHEKIAKEGEDYTIKYYKLKKGTTGLLNMNVIEYNEPTPNYKWLLRINGVSVKGVKEPLFYLSPNRKYDIRITTMGGDHKALYIYNIKVKERDSIVLNVKLKDTFIEYCR
ncbi:Uncharacterised protein [Capnocytophaga ochracea]|jgi:hypothetical protein|uniref:Lipoprotein n=1 Tax=Capnocytophaga ochracea TaxID=1018 RepID=A0A7Z8YFH5_CAPOC|nr:hypothetical protein [Capnocytophaga ochracea]UZD40278.1 hypothetical protein OL231_08845 [Capnocytophaga ochracea]VDG82431.1 Uncharacterised protein [Capnocytophaga ochracea]